jgi:lactoylglutathione lyase
MATNLRATFDHYALSVRNVEASIDFYTRILGLTEIQRPDFDFRGAWLDLGHGLSLHLIEDISMAFVSQSNSRALHFAFGVEDIYAFKLLLINAHILIAKDIKPRPDGALQFFIVDVDGYYIEIVQHLKP